jgi:hypothetical protein
MIIASEKRKTNIAEYVLYMWQVEDIIRACKFDIDIIRTKIISGYKADDKTNQQIIEWYESLFHMMKSENVVDSGHIQLIKNAIIHMDELHKKLLNAEEELQYREKYFLALKNIDLFKEKLGQPSMSEIEICLNALYSLLLLRLSKKEISRDTIEAMNTFSHLLALLSYKFKLWEAGELEDIN